MLVSAGKYNVLLSRSVIVMTAALVWFVFYQNLDEKNQQYQQLTQQLEKQVKRFNQLSDTSKLIDEYAERFNRYIPVSQFENEDRLFWLDQLEVIRVKHKLPKLRYDISQRQPYKYKDGIIKNKGIKVFVSDMTLTMGLMHAGDLMRVIDDLVAIKSSLHVLTACELELRNRNRDSLLTGVSENIEAVCQVKWFTFKVN